MRTSDSCPLLWGSLYGDPQLLRQRLGQSGPAASAAVAQQREEMLEELEAVRMLEQRLAKVLNVSTAHLEPLQIVR